MFSSPEAETWTLLQTLGGIGVFFTATGIARGDSRTVRWVGSSLVVSMTILAVATLVQRRGLNEDEKTTSREKLGGRIQLLHAVIAAGLNSLKE